MELTLLLLLCRELIKKMADLARKHSKTEKGKTFDGHVLEKFVSWKRCKRPAGMFKLLCKCLKRPIDK